MMRWILSAPIIFGISWASMVQADPFSKTIAVLEKLNTFDTAVQCSTIKQGGEKVVCQLKWKVSKAVLIGKANDNPIQNERDNLNVLIEYNVPVPLTSQIFYLQQVQGQDITPRADTKALMQNWLTGQAINPLEGFNQDNFLDTELGQAAAAMGIADNVDALRKMRVTYQALLDFYNSEQKYIVDIEALLEPSGVLLMIDVAGGFSDRRKPRFKADLIKIKNAIVVLTDRIGD